MTASFDLTGKVALITGGSRGLGREMALAFAKADADIAVVSRKLDACYDHFGKVDILVNNAGMSPLYPSLDAVTEDAFDKVIGVNFKGPFRLTVLVGQRMHDGGGGSVINMSSIAALEASPYALPYAGAKAALNSLTAGFAAAYSPN